jgi:hypothetical protein
MKGIYSIGTNKQVAPTELIVFIKLFLQTGCSYGAAYQPVIGYGMSLVEAGLFVETQSNYRISLVEAACFFKK